MIAITENAAKQIHKMLTKNGLEGGGLRVGVKAGGCSGYEYIFAWEKDARPSDQVFTGPDASRIFVDPKSYALLAGHRARLRHKPDEPRFPLQQPERQEHLRLRLVI